MSHKAEATAKTITTKQVVLILGALVIICGSILIAIFLLKPATEARIINEGNLKEIQRNVKENVAKGMFMTHMNTTWNFRNGKSPSKNAILGNAPENNYPFWFTVSLVGEEEPLFQSGLIPVGTEIGEIKLDKVLEKGEYKAVVNIHMVDEDDEEIGNNTSFNVTLIIEN